MTTGNRRIAFGTTFTASHLPYARVLAHSLHAVCPDAPVVGLVVERRTVLDGWNERGLTMVSIEQFGLTDLPQQAFQCAPQALTVLGKPLILKHLLDLGYDTAIFMDADVLVTGNLSPLVATCAAHAITLTPHLLQPAATDPVTRELSMLRSGTFNGGSVAVSQGDEGRRFLEWWFARLRTHNRLEPAAGLHHDQRWLDLAPSFFDGIGIVRDPGCNVAYWNLPERQLRQTADGPMVAGGPCRYFHFSGFDPASPGQLSRHAPHVTRAALGNAASLLDGYAARLREAGIDEARRSSYSFGSFDNGVPIPDAARALLRSFPDAATRFPNPFDPAGDDSFYAWLTSPDERLGRTHRIPVLWGEIHRLRADLQRAFPDPAGQDAKAFLAWTVSSGLREHRIDARLLPAGSPRPAG